MRPHPRIRVGHILLILPLLVVLPSVAGTIAPPGTGGRWLVTQDEQIPKIPPLPRCTVDEGRAPRSAPRRLRERDGLDAHGRRGRPP
jgi:hypothetical protein